MKRAMKYAIILLALMPLMQSCFVNNDYDIDDMNKDAVFLLPPVPIGQVDTFWIKSLEPGQIPDWIFNRPGGLPGTYTGQVVKKQIIKDLFTENFLDNFFYEGALNDVKLEGKADVCLLTPADDIRIDIIVQVLDSEGDVIENVRIPDSDVLKYGQDQPFSIVFPKESFQYMQNAKDLSCTIILRANKINFESIISLSDDNYIFIKELVFKSGGIHVKF